MITIEPGIYFVDFAIDQALKNETLSKYLVAERINEFRGSGGVR